MIKKRIKKYGPKAFWSGTNQIAETLAAFILSILFTRLTTKELYGQYLFILAIFGLISLLSIPGSRVVIMRLVARDIDGIFKKALLWGTKFSLLGVPVLILIGAYFYFFESKEIGIAVLITAIFLPFVSSFKSWLSYYKGKEKFKELALLNILKQGINIISVALAIIFSKNILVVMLAYFASNSLFNVLYCLRISSKIKNTKLSKNWKKQSFSLSTIEVSELAFGRIDVLLIGSMMSMNQVAIYGLVMKVVSVFLKGFRSLMEIIMPKIIRDKNIKISYFNKLFLLTLPLPFVLKPVLELFIVIFYGKEFRDVVTYSHIYIFVLPFFFWYLISGYFMLKYELDNKNNFNRIISIIFVIIAYIILIPKLGILGGIIGSFIYYLVISLLNLISIKNHPH